MSTIKNVFLFVLISMTAAMVSCSKVKYKKTKGGMAYQLYRGKDSQLVRPGDFIKISLTQKVGDSVYFSTKDGLPQYQQVNGQQMPYDISELWTSLHVGDSVVTTQLIDTFMKRSPQNIPPQLKKGDKIMTYVKVLAVFKTDSLARADYDKGNREWLVTEIKTVEKYLADKKINAQKTPSGAYVEILSPGTGTPVDSGKYVSISYTGTNFAGKKFDSNIDPSFGHPTPYSFVVGTPVPSVVKGLDEALKFMRQGTKARVYIPSMLAYGATPQQGSPIKPYEKLIFDLEVVDVKDKAPAQPQQPGQGQPQNIDVPQPQK